jgi:hypothetical protein
MVTSTTPRDTVAEMFPTYGPFSHEQTVRAAGMLAELVRYLNYATADAQGLPGPGTVYDLLGNLRSAVQMLNQTLGQTAHAFGEMSGSEFAEVNNRATTDNRWPAYDVPMTAIALGTEIRDARDLLTDVAARLGDAQVYAGRLVIVGPDEEG